MHLEPRQIASKKIVGKRGNYPVWAIATIGGLHMVVGVNKGKAETLAVSSHPGLSKYMAKKRDPELEWTELSKSEDIDPKHFQKQLPIYESLTEQFRKRQGF